MTVVAVRDRVPSTAAGPDEPIPAPDPGPASGDTTDGARTDRQRRTETLLLAAQAAEDEQARAALVDEVILINRDVADAVANRFRGRGVPLEDLQQAAYEGLVKAVHRFDPSIRPDLLTYAVPMIRGEVQRWLRDHSWAVRPPRRLRELRQEVNLSVERLSQRLGREPTTSEVGEHLGCREDEVREAMQSSGCFRPLSLDQPVADGPAVTLKDTLTTDHDDHAAADARATLAPVLARLSERERTILFLRFFEDRNQAEIGAEVGVTQVQVSRLLTRVLRELRLEIDRSPRRIDGVEEAGPTVAPRRPS